MGQLPDEKKMPPFNLRLVALDGQILPDVDIERLSKGIQQPARRSFLRQLFYDFAYACELYYPVQQFSRMEREKAKRHPPS